MLEKNPQVEAGTIVKAAAFSSSSGGSGDSSNTRKSYSVQSASPQSTSQQSTSGTQLSPDDFLKATRQRLDLLFRSGILTQQGEDWVLRKVKDTLSLNLANTPLISDMGADLLGIFKNQTLTKEEIAQYEVNKFLESIQSRLGIQNPQLFSRLNLVPDLPNVSYPTNPRRNPLGVTEFFEANDLKSLAQKLFDELWFPFLPPSEQKAIVNQEEQAQWNNYLNQLAQSKRQLQSGLSTEISQLQSQIQQLQQTQQQLQQAGDTKGASQLQSQIQQLQQQLQQLQSYQAQIKSESPEQLFFFDSTLLSKVNTVNQSLTGTFNQIQSTLKNVIPDTISSIQQQLQNLYKLQRIGSKFGVDYTSQIQQLQQELQYLNAMLTGQANPQQALQEFYKLSGQLSTLVEEGIITQNQASDYFNSLWNAFAGGGGTQGLLNLTAGNASVQLSQIQSEYEQMIKQIEQAQQQQQKTYSAPVSLINVGRRLIEIEAAEQGAYGPTTQTTNNPLQMLEKDVTSGLNAVASGIEKVFSPISKPLENIVNKDIVKPLEKIAKPIAPIVTTVEKDIVKPLEKIAEPATTNVEKVFSTISNDIKNSFSNLEKAVSSITKPSLPLSINDRLSIGIALEKNLNPVTQGFTRFLNELMDITGGVSAASFASFGGIATEVESWLLGRPVSLKDAFQDFYTSHEQLIKEIQANAGYYIPVFGQLAHLVRNPNEPLYMKEADIASAIASALPAIDIASGAFSSGSAFLRSITFNELLGGGLNVGISEALNALFPPPKPTSSVSVTETGQTVTVTMTDTTTSLPPLWQRIYNEFAVGAAFSGLAAGLTDLAEAFLPKAALSLKGTPLKSIVTDLEKAYQTPLGRFLERGSLYAGINVGLTLPLTTNPEQLIESALLGYGVVGLSEIITNPPKLPKFKFKFDFMKSGVERITLPEATWKGSLSEFTAFGEDKPFKQVVSLTQSTFEIFGRTEEGAQTLLKELEDSTLKPIKIEQEAPKPPKVPKTSYRIFSDTGGWKILDEINIEPWEFGGSNEAEMIFLEGEKLAKNLGDLIPKPPKAPKEEGLRVERFSLQNAFRSIEEEMITLKGDMYLPKFVKDLIKELDEKDIQKALSQKRRFFWDIEEKRPLEATLKELDIENWSPTFSVEREFEIWNDVNRKAVDWERAIIKEYEKIKEEFEEKLPKVETKKSLKDIWKEREQKYDEEVKKGNYREEGGQIQITKQIEKEVEELEKEEEKTISEVKEEEVTGIWRRIEVWSLLRERAETDIWARLEEKTDIWARLEEIPETDIWARLRFRPFESPYIKELERFRFIILRPPFEKNIQWLRLSDRIRDYQRFRERLKDMLIPKLKFKLKDIEFIRFNFKLGLTTVTTQSSTLTDTFPIQIPLMRPKEERKPISFVPPPNPTKSARVKRGGRAFYRLLIHGVVENPLVVGFYTEGRGASRTIHPITKRPVAPHWITPKKFQELKYK